MTSPLPDRMTSADAASLLDLKPPRFHDIAKARGWSFELRPGGRKLWLREDVEREREVRLASKPEGGWRKAAAAKKADPKPTTQRKCLRCRESFESRWIGNRLCEPCNAYAAATRSAIDL